MINVTVSMKERRNTTAKQGIRTTIIINDAKVATFAKEKTRDEFDENFSAYIRTLIRRDMANGKQKAA